MKFRDNIRGARNYVDLLKFGLIYINSRPAYNLNYLDSLSNNIQHKCVFGMCNNVTHFVFSPLDYKKLIEMRCFAEHLNPFLAECKYIYILYSERIYQLYHRGQFYWWRREQEYPK